MKKRSIALWMAIVCSMTALCFAGCQGSDNSKNEPEQNVAEQENKTEEIDKNDESGKTDSDKQDSSDEDSAAQSKLSASDYMKAYQDFLNGKSKEGSDQGIAEYTEELCDEYTKEYGFMSVLPDGISYSFIDCGNDGIPELAVAFDGVGNENIKTNYITVFKLIDDEIKCIFKKGSGYRAFAMLNEYGYYTYGGANGAGSHCVDYYYIDAEGNANFLYGIDNSLSVYSFYIPDNDNYIDVADEEGIADNLEIDMYYYELYEDQGLKEYMNSCDFIYYPVSDNWNRLEGDRLKEATKGGGYERFWESTGLKLSTQEQIDKKVDGILNKVGVDDTILNGEEVEWIELSAARMDEILSWKSKYEIPVTQLENVSWEYYYSEGKPKAKTHLAMGIVAKEPNSVIDDDVWFDGLGVNQPDYFDFTDQDYEFVLYGEDPSGLRWYPYMMDIFDLSSGAKLYTLDFSEYYTPDNIKPGDESFVDECIHWAATDDGILYVSTFHNTYAYSAPHNGYITAFDMNDNFKVLWRTEPLTCNSNNFVVLDDAIICGYGFTDENDYVYVLDKETGLRTDSYKVKTSPDWFVMRGDQLFVRCYDTNYVFDVVK